MASIRWARKQKPRGGGDLRCQLPSGDGRSQKLERTGFRAQGRDGHPARRDRQGSRRARRRVRAKNYVQTRLKEEMEPAYSSAEIDWPAYARRERPRSFVNEMLRPASGADRPQLRWRGTGRGGDWVLFKGKYQRLELFRAPSGRLHPQLTVRFADQIAVVQARAVGGHEGVTISAPEGTTVLGVQVQQTACIVAGDRLATAGHTVASREVQKVFATDAHSLMAISGAAGPSIEMATDSLRWSSSTTRRSKARPLELEGKANKPLPDDPPESTGRDAGPGGGSPVRRFRPAAQRGAASGSSTSRAVATRKREFDAGRLGLPLRASESLKTELACRTCRVRPMPSKMAMRGPHRQQQTKIGPQEASISSGASSRSSRSATVDGIRDRSAEAEIETGLSQRDGRRAHGGRGGAQ